MVKDAKLGKNRKFYNRKKCKIGEIPKNSETAKKVQNEKTEKSGNYKTFFGNAQY